MSDQMFNDSKYPVGVWVEDGMVFRRAPKDGFPAVYVPNKPEDLEDVLSLVHSIHDMAGMDCWTSEIEASYNLTMLKIREISTDLSFLDFKNGKDCKEKPAERSGSVWIEDNKVHRWDLGASFKNVYTPKLSSEIYELLTRAHHLQMMAAHPESTDEFAEMLKLETGLIIKMCSSIKKVR